MKILNNIPAGYEEIVSKYGEPGDVRMMQRFLAPFPLKISWDKTIETNWIYGHKDIVPVFIDGLHEVLHVYGKAYIVKYELDIFGGCFNNRNKRGIEEPSTHAWGIAIDYIPNYGPYHKEGRVPKPIVDIFKKRGFVWGGDWIPADGMHWQACKDY